MPQKVDDTEISLQTSNKKRLKEEKRTNKKGM